MAKGTFSFSPMLALMQSEDRALILVSLVALLLALLGLI